MEIRQYPDYREDEVLSLYSSVGWAAYTENPAALREGFARSLLVLAAYEEDRLIGLIRIIGDESTVIFIQDILVRPENQHHGVGTALVNRILERYKHVRQIQLTADCSPETAAFYRSVGFRDITEIGCSGFIKC